MMHFPKQTVMEQLNPWERYSQEISVVKPDRRKDCHRVQHLKSRPVPTPMLRINGSFRVTRPVLSPPVPHTVASATRGQIHVRVVSWS